jgi:hypothetical protein
MCISNNHGVVRRISWLQGWPILGPKEGLKICRGHQQSKLFSKGFLIILFRPWSGWDFETVRIQNRISARSTLLEVTYLKALLYHITKILVVGFYSLYPLVPTALGPGETFSVFFLDPVQRISTRSYVSQCQLIYSVITTAISLILGLFPAEILLLMCFCHIKHHHDVAVFCHHFSFSRLHIFAPCLFVSSRF